MKKSRFLIAVFCLTLFVMSDAASAATYTVAKDGSGNFGTIQEAANVAVAGDTVQVKAGTYNEYVIIKNSGIVGKPITFKAVGAVTVTYPYSSMPSWSGLFWIKNKQYIAIDGFKLVGGYTCIDSDASSNIIIKNNTCENPYAAGIKVGWGYSDNVIVTNNIVNRFTDPSTIQYNEMISISNAHNSEIRNNHVMRNTEGEAIVIKDASSLVKVYNNFMEKSKVGIYAGGCAEGGSHDIEIYNNIAGASTVAGSMGIAAACEISGAGTGIVRNIYIHDNWEQGNSLGIGLGTPNAGNTARYDNIRFENNHACENRWLNYLFARSGIIATNIQDINNTVPSPCTVPTWNPCPSSSSNPSPDCTASGTNPNPQPSQTQMTLKPGWNQISSPLAAGIDLATIESSCTILQYKNQKLWAWNAEAQSWTNPAKVEPFRGHWIYIAYTCTVPISGTPATFSSLQLYSGWNKVSASGALSAISGTCSGHIIGNWIWNWDKATEKWVHPTAMQLDKGYWIKVDQNCVFGA